MSGYDLSRKWFDFCFENPEKIKPNHTALYFFCIEQCNRLGWKEKFCLPSSMAKEAIGIHSYNTYIKTLRDLISFGFIELVKKSKNQHSSNIIALSNFDKALDKALDRAIAKSDSCSIKFQQSTGESKCSINKHITYIDIYAENYTDDEKTEFTRFNKWVDEEVPELRKKGKQIDINQYFKLKRIEKFSGDELKDYSRRLANWSKSNSTVYHTLIGWRNKDRKNGK